MAKQTICKKTIEGDTVTFAFSNGSTATVSPENFSPEIQTQLMAYGISQKLGDSYAGSEGPDEAQAAFQSTLDQLAAGEWKVRRASGAPRVTQLAEALAAVTGQELAVCQEKIAGMDDDQRKGLRAHPQVAAKLAEIKAQKAQAAAAKALEEAQGAEAPALDF